MFLELFNLRKDPLLKLSAIFITLSSIAGFFHYPMAYYLSLLLVVLMMVVSRGRIKVNNKTIILFLLICLISLLVNNPPSYFRTWSRLGGFSLLLLTVSPILVSEKVGMIRIKLLKYTLIACVLLSVGSFIAYFLGINLYVRGGELQDISSGRFSGLMNHSMLLGPIAAISSMYMVFYMINTKNIGLKVIYIIVAFCCFAASLLAASRIAVLGGVAGLLFFILRYYRERVSKVIMTVLLLLCVAVVSFPMWGGFTDFLVEKQAANYALGGALYSRESKIDARIEEFKSSPIIGIGFNAIDPSLDVVNLDNGQIEPGSSWLEIPAMTGVLGFVVFLVIAIRATKRAWLLSDRLVSSFLIGLLVFFFIHMLSEGWILSVRAFLSFLFWLTLGATYAIGFDSDAHHFAF